MNINNLYMILNEYERSKSLARKYMFFCPACNPYMELLRGFIDVIYARSLSQNKNNDENVVSEQDISFAEFKSYLERSNQWESFKNYLSEQLKKTIKKQDLTYKLIMTWKAEEYNRKHNPLPAEIWYRIFEYLPLRDAVQVSHVCKYFNNISQRFIVSQRLCLRGQKRFTCLEISGDTLVTGSSDHTARIWDLTTGECRHILKGHKDSIISVTISANTVVTGGGNWDKSARIWDLTTGQFQYVLKHGDWIIFLAISGNTLVSGGYDDARIWDLTTQQYWRILKGYKHLSCYAFSNVLAIGDYNAASIWNVTNGDQLYNLAEHTSFIICLVISGNTLVTGGSDCTARIWDLNTGQCQHVLRGHENAIYCLAISGNTLVTGSSDHTARIWNLNNGKCREILKHGKPIFYLAISSDTLVMGSWCLAISGNTLVTLIRKLPTMGNRFVKLASIWSLTTKTCQQVLVGNDTEGGMGNAKICAWVWNLPPKKEVIEDSETAVSVMPSCNLEIGASVLL